MSTSEEIVNGLVGYVEKEIIPKMDTPGKWLVGAMLGMITAKCKDIAIKLQGNEIAKAIGAISEDGLFDVDLIKENLMKSATRYGNLQISIPMLGTMTFTPSDIESASKYIKGNN